jgi:hypothetical protein
MAEHKKKPLEEDEDDVIGRQASWLHSKGGEEQRDKSKAMAFSLARDNPLPRSKPSFKKFGFLFFSSWLALLSSQLCPRTICYLLSL